MTELWSLTATHLALLIAQREVSSREVVEAYLGRQAEVNPKVNAIVRPMADEARAAADAADRLLARGGPVGRLHGVPFTIKENIDYAGLPTTWGVPAFADLRPESHAPVVDRMLAAGAIPIGRTNVPDMALRVHTVSSLHGLTRNPWDATRTAAGSSGGEAVALATGMSALGLGNDIGGSLRNPANACGIASIRPSFGRVPDVRAVPSPERRISEQLMNTQGPMARSVDDVRACLEILSGADARDPWSLDPSSSPTGTPCAVAVVPHPPGGSIDPAIAATVRRAADALADAGYQVDEVCPPSYEQTIGGWSRLLVADFAAVRSEVLAVMDPDAIAFFDAFYAEDPPGGHLAALSGALVLRDQLSRQWSEFMAGYPLVLTPVWTQLPFEHGFDTASPQGVAATFEMIRPVVVANFLGLPSACVPAGRDESTGLPIGVLVNGRRFADFQCLDAAQAIENRLGISTPISPRW